MSRSITVTHATDAELDALAKQEQAIREWEQRTGHSRQVIEATLRTAPAGFDADDVAAELENRISAGASYIADVFGGPCPWCAGAQHVAEEPCAGCTAIEDDSWCTSPRQHYGGWSEPDEEEPCGDCDWCTDREAEMWREWWVTLDSRRSALPDLDTLPVYAEPCDETALGYWMGDAKCDGSCVTERTAAEWIAFAAQRKQLRDDARAAERRRQRESNRGPIDDADIPF